MHEKDLTLCSNCDGPLGPDALEFSHQGNPAGGICENCQQNIKGIKVVFDRNAENILRPMEVVLLEQIVTE